MRTVGAIINRPQQGYAEHNSRPQALYIPPAGGRYGVDFLDYFNVISSLAALGATIIAAAELRNSRKYQQKTEDNNRKTATIDAFNILQEQVLDKFVSYSKTDVWNLINNIDEPKIKKAYDDCRAMIAKIEHFAVGVNCGVYDIDITNRLGGVHLIYLFYKLEPVINYTRNIQSDTENPFYCEFENLVNTLKLKQPDCI